MANKLYEETYIQNIANAIREKTGKEDTMAVAEMAEEIKGMEVGGGNGTSNNISYIKRIIPPISVIIEENTLATDVTSCFVTYTMSDVIIS